MKKKILRLTPFLVAVTILIPVTIFTQDTPGTPSGNGIQPVVVGGNPDCGDIGIDNGFKVESAPTGSFTLDASDGGQVTTGTGDPNNSVTIAQVFNSRYFDWSATLGVDAIIVKGGDNANVYFYPSFGSTGDTQLHPPVNQFGNPRNISHIEFCWDQEVEPCDFEVTCPDYHNLGTFDCNNREQIPPLPATEAELVNTYGIQVSVCKQAGIITYDSRPVNTCAANDHLIYRMIRVFDDLDMDGQWDQHQEPISPTCVFTIRIEVDDQPPSVECHYPVNPPCHLDPADMAQYLIDQHIVTAADNCSNATVMLVSSDVQPGNECGATYSFTFKAVDECQNETPEAEYCIVEFSCGGGDGFEVSCPDNQFLGFFNCSTIDQLPPLPENAADLTGAPYHIQFSVCQQLGIDARDSKGVNFCLEDDYLTQRTIRIFDDLDGDGHWDPGAEPSETCVFFYRIEIDDQPPQVHCSDYFTPPCHLNPQDMPQYLIENHIVTASDDCPDASVMLVSSDTDPDGECGINYAFTFKAVDECQNETPQDGYCTVEFSCGGGDGFEVSCPDNRFLGTFNCNNIDQLPPLPENAADLTGAPYHIQFSVCQQLGIKAQDNKSTDLCADHDYSVQRTIRIFHDLDGDGHADYQEPSETCTFLFTVVVDDTPPVITCSGGGNVDCGDPLPVPSASAVDDCSGEVDVHLTQHISGNICDGYRVSCTFSTSDNCDNEASCTKVARVNAPPAPRFETAPPDIQISCDDPTPQPSPLHYSNGAGISQTVLYRVNAGGNELSSASYPNWGKDVSAMNSPYLVDNGSNGNFATTSAITLDASVPSGVPMSLFQRERWDNTGGAEMQYGFPGFAAGTEVEVHLYLAEIFSGVTGPNQRVFDVAVEGTVPHALEGIDPWAIADELNEGNGGQNYGFVLSAPATVGSDGVLNIEFIHIMGNPAVKGIEIALPCSISGKVMSALTFRHDDCRGYWRESWSFTDECNRTITASRRIDVVDERPPAVHCNEVQTPPCDLDPVDIPQYLIDRGIVTATDNCPGAEPVVVSAASSTSDECGDVNYSITFKAVDACGNETPAHSYCTVEFTCPGSCGAPEIDCPPDIEMACDETGECITFDDFEKGELITTVATKSGNVSFFGFNPTLGTTVNAAMIFDSGTPTAGCEDLGTPNEDFDGPGIGTGGDAGKFQNDNELANLLIVSKDLNQEHPDDVNAQEARITIDFSDIGTVTVEHLNLIDIETANAKIRLLGTGGVHLETIYPHVSGNNGVQLVNLGPTSRVEKMIVLLNGSGAIDNLCFTTETPTGFPTADDDCDPDLNFSFSDEIIAGECPNAYTVERTWTARNACGLESSCTQFIHIFDETRPRWNNEAADIIIYTSEGSACPSPTDLSVEADQDNPIAMGRTPATYSVHGMEFLTPNDHVTDNCSDVDNLKTFVWKIEDYYGGSADDCSRQIRIVFRLFDECGLFRDQDIIYTIVDDSPPSGSCPAGLIGLPSMAHVPAPDESTVAANFTDNCSSVSVEFLHSFETTFECGSTGINQVYEVSDDCGNSVQCTILHTVGGTPGVITGDCPRGSNDLICLEEVPPPPSPEEVAAGYSGNGDIIAFLINTTVEGNNCTGFTKTYKYQVTDGCSAITCNIKYAGRDFKRPKGDCPEGMTGITRLEDIPEPDPEEIAAQYMDECGSVSVDLIETIENFEDLTNFSVTYVYLVSDPCGNTLECEVTHTGRIRIEGSCPEGAEGFTCIDDVPPADPEGVAANYTTGCDGGVHAEVFRTYVTDRYCLGFRILYVYEVTDDCGNTKYCGVAYEGTNCPEDCEGGNRSVNTASDNQPPKGRLPSAGYDQILPTPDFDLYPNPTLGNVNIRLWNFPEKEVVITVFNMLGDEVYSTKNSTSKGVPVPLNLRAAGLPDGTYLVNVRSVTHNLTRKLVLARTGR